MRITLIFLLFCLWFTAQKTKNIELNKNIKDKKGHTKSLTFIDQRTDHFIGFINYHDEPVELKLAAEDSKSLFEKWYSDDNKNAKGSAEITVILEELKVEYTPEKYPIAKIKIASFLKRNDKYYFVNRYQNVDSFFARSTPNTISDQIAVNIADFIVESYTKTPIGIGIPENEILNYEMFLNDKIKIYQNNPLIEGVYGDYKSFRDQVPMADYHTVKNKKGEIVRMENKNNLRVRDLDLFGFVDQGIPYKITPVGYLEIFKDKKGMYIVSNKSELIPQNSGGMTVGLMMGGGIGAVAIGLLIDSQSRKNRPDSGFYNVYIDSFTGDYSYEK